MIKAVPDANILVSGLISRQGPPGQILDDWMAGRRFHLFVSPQTLDELQRVLRYPKIRKYITEDQVTRLLTRLKQDAEQVEGTVKLDILKLDPSDNIYLACAIEAGADYLVTGNLDHFEEAGRISTGVSIVSPREFLHLLESN